MSCDDPQATCTDASSTLSAPVAVPLPTAHILAPLPSRRPTVLPVPSRDGDSSPSPSRMLRDRSSRLLAIGRSAPDAGVDVLIQACEAGELTAVKAALTAGVPVNARATYGGSVARSAEARLAALGDSRVVSSAFGTPLHAAAWARQEHVCEFLMAAGADVHMLDADRRSPLHVAAHKGLTRLAVRMCEAGAHVNAATKHGWTPLHWAAEAGHAPIISYLLTLRVDTRARDAEGKTALDVAVFKGHDDCVSLLRSSSPTSSTSPNLTLLPPLDTALVTRGAAEASTPINSAQSVGGRTSSPAAFSPAASLNAYPHTEGVPTRSTSSRSLAISLPSIPPEAAPHAVSPTVRPVESTADVLAAHARMMEAAARRADNLAERVQELHAQLHLASLTISRQEYTIQSLSTEVRAGTCSSDSIDEQRVAVSVQVANLRAGLRSAPRDSST